MNVIWAALKAFLPTQAGLIAAGAIIAFLGAAYLAIDWRAYNRGYAAAIHKLASQDQEAVNASARARARYLLCVDSGGVWHVETGKCSRR